MKRYFFIGMAAITFSYADQPKNRGEVRQEQRHQQIEQPRQGHEQIHAAPTSPQEVVHQSRVHNEQKNLRGSQPVLIPRSPSLSRTINESRHTQKRSGSFKQTPKLESLKQQAHLRHHPKFSSKDNVKKQQDLRSSFQKNRTTAQNVASRVKTRHPGYHKWLIVIFSKNMGLTPTIGMNMPIGGRGQDGAGCIIG